MGHATRFSRILQNIQHNQPKHKVFRRKAPKPAPPPNPDLQIATTVFQKKNYTARIFCLLEQGIDLIFATEVNETLQLPLYIPSHPTQRLKMYIKLPFEKNMEG